MSTPAHTGSTTTRVLGVLVLVGIVVVSWLGLVASPPDTDLGETVRLLYVHVPVVSFAYTSCAICTVASLVWFFRRTQWWDVVASSAAEIGALLTGLTLVTGMLWGRPTWGAYWVWDARLTTTLLLFLLLLGYLAIRRIPSPAATRSTRSGVVGLLLLPNVFIVNRSVEWWRSLHQDPTLMRTDLRFGIRDMQLFTLWTAFVLGLLVFLWLMIHRFRVGILADRVEEQSLDQAIRERRAEGAGIGGGVVAMPQGVVATGVLHGSTVGWIVGSALLVGYCAFVFRFSSVELTDPPGVWAYIAGGWIVTAVSIAAYAAWLVHRGHVLSRELEPERRRWM